MDNRVLSKAVMLGILDKFPKVWHDLPLEELLALEEELSKVLKKVQGKVGGTR